MKIDEVNNPNVDKYLEGYPENVKTALSNLSLCLCGKGIKHIVKFYKIGYFGVPDGLQREVEIKQNPYSDILRKYYPELGYLGNVSMTFSIHKDTGRISPAYYDNDTERYYSFTEEMMANKGMWDEMANVELPKPTVEYAEEKPLDEKYDEWKQYQMKGTLINGNQTGEQITNRYNSLNEHCKKLQKEYGVNEVKMLPIVPDYGLSFSYYFANYIAEKEHNIILENKETITYKLPMVALVVSLVALIINLIIKFVL